MTISDSTLREIYQSSSASFQRIVKLDEFIKDCGSAKENSGGSVSDKAKEIIKGDREKVYGHPAKNMEVIAELWSAYLGDKVTASDVCNMMVLFKVSRLKNTPNHEDSMVDIVGYTLLNEIIHKGD